MWYKAVHFIQGMQHENSSSSFDWYWTHSAASAPPSWHAALPAPASCLSWVLFVQEQHRCFSDLHCRFPVPVYHCHTPGPNQTSSHPTTPLSASFPKVLHICRGFQMHSFLNPCTSSPELLFTYLIFPHPLILSWSCLPPSTQIKRAPISPMIHLQLIYFCLGFLHPHPSI